MIEGVQALIFDVDGTLSETEEAHRHSFNAAFAEAGLDWNWSRDDYRELLKVTGGKERISAFMGGMLGGRAPLEPPSPPSGILPPEGGERAAANPVSSPPGGSTGEAGDGGSSLASFSIPALHARKTELYLARVAAGEVALRTGVEILIREARHRGIKLAIATTTSRPNVDVLIAGTLGAEAIAWFDPMICGDMVAAKKPAPDVYIAALAGLDLAPDAAVAIEDSWNGIRSARAAGLRVIATPSLYSAGDNFSEATAVVKDATHIAGVLGWD